MFIFYYIISIHTTHSLPCPDFHLQQGNIPLTIKGQVVVHPNDVLFAAQLLRRADVAAYPTSDNAARYERRRYNPSYSSTIVEPPPPASSLLWSQDQPTVLPYHP